MPDPAWNHTERAYPAALLPRAFSDQVSRTPESIALSFREEQISYAELDRRVDRLARHLRALGVRANTLVGVCMERSVEMVVALYAIQRAGGAYVPIDPEYPADRIAFMLEDLEGPVLLSQHHLAETMSFADATVIAIDRPLSPLPDPGSADLPEIGPDDLAYVIYTSGSTGRPKGAIMTHRAIANRIYWMQEYFGMTPEDTVLQKTPYSFDVSVWEFFWPLMVGARLVVAEPGGHRDGTYLVQAITRHAVTTIHFVPSMLQLFLETPGVAACRSLKWVVCSGEALPRALQDRFFGRFDARLINLYGPTEAAVDVTVWECDRSSALPFVPIGVPVANTQMYILDANLRAVPVGEAGDLYIGGVQVGQGYLNRPDLTADRFLADPFRPGGTLYKTGDLARYLPDGNIEFLGRSDFQVKIRGFRVELGEIEAALEAIDGVRGAVVVARERADQQLELVGYISHQAADRLVVETVRSALLERLPEYMVPTIFVVVNQFPLTPSGKVDRKALPEPVRQRPLDTPYVGPRTPLQRLIVGRWRAILDLDRVGIHDRFFELGGTSLQAARFVNQMQDDMDETILVMTLFEAPTVAEYSSLLERDHPAGVARLTGTQVSAPADAGLPSALPPVTPLRSREALTSQRGRRQAG